MPTVREIMNGPKGGFARALLNAHGLPTLSNLIMLRQVADGENQVILDSLFPGLLQVQTLLNGVWCSDNQLALERGFPMLERLDEQIRPSDATEPPRMKRAEIQVQHFYDIIEHVEDRLRDRGPITIAAPAEERLQ